MKVVFLVLALSLGGCASWFERGQQAADAAAQANVKLLCAITVGAYYRMNNPKIQQGIRMICEAGGTDLGPGEPLFEN